MATHQKKNFYQTWWFWAIAILVVLFIVGGGVGYWRFHPRIVAGWRRIRMGPAVRGGGAIVV